MMAVSRYSRGGTFTTTSRAPSAGTKSCGDGSIGWEIGIRERYRRAGFWHVDMGGPEDAVHYGAAESFDFEVIVEVAEGRSKGAALFRSRPLIGPCDHLLFSTDSRL